MCLMLSATNRLGHLIGKKSVQVHLMEWVRAVVATTLGVPHDGALPPIMMQQEVPSIWDQIRECYSAGISVYAVPIPVLVVQPQNMCPCPVRSVRKVTIFQTTSPANRLGWSQIGCQKGFLIPQ